MCSPSNHSRCRRVSSSDLEKCSITSLAHQWKWMGAVRMRVQTADKNITIIHTTPVHQLTSWEVKSSVFVRNKSTVKMFWTSNYCFWPKKAIILLPPVEKKSNLVWIRRESLQAKTVLNKYVAGFCERQQEEDFFTGGSVIMDSYFSRKQQFEVKEHLNERFVSYKHASFLFNVIWWTGVDYLWIIVMFLSAVWTLTLTAPIHCTSEQVISTNLMKKQTHLHLRWPERESFSANCVNCTFKQFQSIDTRVCLCTTESNDEVFPCKKKKKAHLWVCQAWKTSTTWCCRV